MTEQEAPPRSAGTEERGTGGSAKRGAVLAIMRGGEEILRFPLGDRTLIGRSSECDLAIPDPDVSRQQAIVEWRADGFRLIDRSGRGTRVAGEEVEEAVLSDGTEIGLGRLNAVFRSKAPTGSETTRVSGQTISRGEREPLPKRAAYLRVRNKEGEQIVPLNPDPFTIGTGTACSLVLKDLFVSSRHARFESKDGRWYVADLGSTNGTFLDRGQILRGEVHPGTTVTIGDTELTLMLADSADQGETGTAPYCGMLTCDPGMRQVFDGIERIASSSAAVVVLGETGTGKELVARALHDRSDRRQGPFVPVNCSAIAETLIESELFGHEKGAFSGADRMRKGAFEEADGGTLFLDEIGELSLDLQPKLLRVLELGEVKRVGATRPIHVAVRIVAATHRDLRAEVRGKRFREDLYYRLSVLPIEIPPLRNRKKDIRLLAQLFLSEVAPPGLRISWSEKALALLEQYDWPGNVRQLKNVVYRALFHRGEGSVLEPETVVFNDTRGDVRVNDDDMLYLPGLTLEKLQREALRSSLRRHNGQRRRVEEELGISRSTLQKYIAERGLQNEGRKWIGPDDEEGGGSED